MFTRNFSGRKNPWFKTGLWAAFALFMAALVFTGCPQPADSVPEPPAKPVITSVLSASATSLTVNWQSVTDAASYEVYYNTSDSTAGAKTENVSITETTATITSLTADTSYYVWVRAKNSAGTSEYSASASETPRVAEISGLTLPDGWYKGRALPPYDDGYNRSGEIITYYGNGDKDINFEGRALKYADNVVVIQVTRTNEWGPTVGKYYGVYINDATPFSFTGAGAYKQDGKNSGVDTLDAAVSEYTDNNGYFGIKAGYGLYAEAATVTANSTTLNVSWPAVSGANGYDLYYSISTGSTDLPTSSTNPSTANVTITNNAAAIIGLTDLMPHYVWVRAKTDSNTGAWVYQGCAEPEIIPAGLAQYFQSLPYSAEYAYYDDGFAVDAEAKTFYYYSDSTFDTKWGGPIVKIVPEDGAFIMIIEITDVTGTLYTPPETGKYFAAIYKNLSESSVNSSTAYKQTDGKNTGVDTIGVAVSEYTIANGYFPTFLPSYYPHAASAETLAALQGNWVTEDVTEDKGYYIGIKGTKLIEWTEGDPDSYDGVYDTAADGNDTLGELGDIVDHTDTTQASGILYVRIIDGGSIFTADKYIAIAWKDKTDSDIRFMTGTTAYDTLEAVKTAYGDAANENQFASNGFHSYTKAQPAD
jgi:hypothetical protein